MNTQNKTNLSLIFGLLILLITMIITFFGPSIAPRDPLAQESLLYFNGEWDTPPYLPGTPRYPFGSDEFGRDILSRLLWAVQPTMALIFLAATLRILLGILFGMLASGKNAFFASLANTSISYALALPILLIAFTIVLPYKRSPTPPFWPFVFALTLTGWGEVAQIVRDEVYKLKQQAFIEAAQSVGASPWNIFKNHILRHLTPLMLIMINFELAKTLLLTSTLGFLGFYLGGVTSIGTVVDGNFILGSVYPDLGEMLATTTNIPIQPWGLVFAGSTVFAIIFGFNLVGHGLRQLLKSQQTRSLKGWRLTSFNWGMELDQRLAYPIQIFSYKYRRPLIAMICVLSAWIGYSWILENLGRVQQEIALIQYEVDYLADAINEPTLTAVPQNAGGAEILWQMEFPQSLSAAPDLSVPGQLMLYSVEPALYAFSTEGESLWELSLQEDFVYHPSWIQTYLLTFPATTQGVVYMLGLRGIQAISSDGEILWQEEFEGEIFQGLSINQWRCCTIASHGRFYLIDDYSTIRVYDPFQGFLWEYQATDEHVPDDFGIYVGHNGEIYVAFYPGYGSNEQLLALTADGQIRWEIEIPDTESVSLEYTQMNRFVSFFFSESLIFTDHNGYSREDGSLQIEFNRSNIQISENVLNSLEDSIIFENLLDSFYFVFRTGELGEIYLLASYADPNTWESTRYLLEVNINGQNLEVLSIRPNIASTPHEPINSSGIIVSYWPSEYVFRVSNINPPNQSSEIILDENTYSLFNNETGQLLVCDPDRDTEITACSYYPPFGQEIQFRIEGVTSIYHWSMDWENGVLYLFDRRKVLHVIQCPIQ